MPRHNCDEVIHLLLVQPFLAVLHNEVPACLLSCWVGVLLPLRNPLSRTQRWLVSLFPLHEEP
jgi:hypothetical protein